MSEDSTDHQENMANQPADTTPNQGGRPSYDPVNPQVPAPASQSPQLPPRPNAEDKVRDKKRSRNR